MEKIIYPPAEAPVNIKNFLSFPSTFCFRVKNIKAPPNKSSRAPEIIIKSKLIYPLSAGMNIVQTITAKIPINPHNITVNLFLSIFTDYISLSQDIFILNAMAYKILDEFVHV